MYRAASADNELSSEGATLYCPWFACIDCARAIICAGVKECVGVKGVMELTPERWAASIKQAEEMLIEAGVKCTYIEGKIGARMFFDG